MNLHIITVSDTAASRRQAGHQNLEDSTMDGDDGALTDDEGTTVVNNSRAETPMRPGIKAGTL